MFTLPWLFDWLALSSVTSLLLFSLGSLAVLCCRQPVRRMRIIVLTLGGCLVAPLISLAPGLPHWSLPKLETRRGEEASLTQAPSGGVVEFKPVVQKPDALMRTDVDITTSAPAAPIELATAPDVEVTVRSSATPAPEDIHSKDPVPATEIPPAATAADSSLADIRRVAAAATVASASRISPATSSAADLQQAIVTAYLTGLALLAAWGVIGLAGLRRVLHVARPAPQWCRALLCEIAGPAAGRVQILVSPRARQPFTFAWCRPVIVLPVAITAKESDCDLRWSLAHEWSHIARGDVWVWSFAGLVRLVYYYQPLGWWLRRHLRLCQDYVADAAAARQSSAADYAEFLTTRAAGRPLAVGLGIASGPSDLYRRVTMLLKNPHPLETRCSRTWTTGVAAVAGLLILSAATFGDRAEIAAAEEKGVTATTEEQVNVPTPVKPEISKATKPLRKVAQDRERILRRLATRDSLHSSGIIEFNRRSPVADDSAQGEFFFANSSEGWVMRPAALSPGDPTKPLSSREIWARENNYINRGELTLVHGGRCLQGQVVVMPPRASDQGRTVDSSEPRVGADGPIVIRYAEVAANVLERGTPHGMGTIYYDSGRQFIRKNAAEARFVGSRTLDSFEPILSPPEDRDRTTNGKPSRSPEVQVIEWDVSADAASEAFPDYNPFLKLGGILRICVCVAEDDAVVRIEGIDRFDTVQFSADFREFGAESVGELFPSQALIKSGGEVTFFQVTRLSQSDEPRAVEQFTLDIPEGVRVTDLRPHSKDQFDQYGGFLGINSEEYPLRQFVTTARYRPGFPAKLLAELDRDVLSWEKAKQALLGNGPGASPRTMGAAPAMMAAPMGSMGPFDIDMLNHMTNAMRNLSVANQQMTTQQQHLQQPRFPDGSDNSTLNPLAALQRAFPRTKRAVGGPEEKRGGDAANDPAEAGTAKPERRTMVYGDKTFADWQQTLMTDLETESRIKCLTALDAFAANGFAEETAETIYQALIDDLVQRPQSQLAEAACGTLARTGKAGLPALEKLAAVEDKGTLQLAWKAIATIVAKTPEAVPFILTIIKREAPTAEGTLGPVYRELASRYLDLPEVAEVLNEGISNRDRNSLSAMLSGFRESKASSDVLVPLLLKAMTVDSYQIPPAAAAILARRGPVTESTIQTITKYLDDCDSKMRLQLVRQLHSGPYGANPKIALPILIAGFDKSGWFATSPEMLLAAMVDTIGSFGPQAEAAIPVLLKALRNELPNQGYDLQLQAAGALGNIGQAAAEAVPLLNELLNKPPDFRALGQSGPEQALDKWRNRLRTAIRKIEAQ